MKRMERGEEELLESLRVAAATLGAALSNGCVPLADCHLCVTGFEQDDRDCVAELAAALGGAYSSELARGTCTHLVTTDGSTTSAKCRHAQRWGDVHVVSLRWLVACVEEQGAPPGAPANLAPVSSLLPLPQPTCPKRPTKSRCRSRLCPLRRPRLPCRCSPGEEAAVAHLAPLFTSPIAAECASPSLCGTRYTCPAAASSSTSRAASRTRAPPAVRPAAAAHPSRSVDRIRNIAWVGGAVVVGERGTATHVVSSNPALPGERSVLLTPRDVLQCAT